MELNLQKSKIQDEVVEDWIYKTKCRGTVEIPEGYGKNFLFFKALYTMPRKKLNVTHLYLAERQEEEINFLKEMDNFNKTFNCKISEDYNIQFRCYQNLRNVFGYKYGLVGASEIQHAMTPENYGFFINNAFDSVLGLTSHFPLTNFVTIKRHPNIRKKFSNDVVSQVVMLDAIAPRFYKYDGTKRLMEEKPKKKLDVLVIEHELEALDKTISIGTAQKPHYQTEKTAYCYINLLFNKALIRTPKPNEDLYDFQERKNIDLIRYANRRSKLLHNLPSKVKIIKELLTFLLNDKTMIFGNSLESLSKFNTSILSVDNTEEENKRLRSNFNKGLTNKLACFNKFKLDSLVGIDNCIIMSHNSSDIDLVQQMSMLPQHADKVSCVFILIAKGTQEELWLKKILEKTENCTIERITIKDYIDLNN